IDEGVRQGYKEGYLRKSIVEDPLSRTNTKDNTPSIIHLKSVSGDKIKISLTAKGGGAENMSAIKMLAPANGVEGIKQFIIDTVKNAGANACPPVIVGVGIGGTFEKAAILAKESLLRELGSNNEDPFYDALEKELLNTINKLGTGPMGLGGKVTSLGVFIKTYPCHIASLPVAVNMQCHSARHKSIEL
ncbi:fumarate hydratase, partial [bacterium]